MELTLVPDSKLPQRFTICVGSARVAVGSVSGDGLNSPGSISRHGQNFSPLHSVQTSSGAYPMSTGASLSRFPPGVKRSGREADHSPPSNAEVKNGGAVPPLPRMFSWHSV
jgi:hypothetical protein